MSAAWPGGETGPRLRREDNTRHVRLSVTERREFWRGSCALSATLILNNEAFSAELLDISAGGAQLRCSVVPGEGAEIGIEVSGFGLLHARVVRRLPKGIAVEFYFTELQRAEFSERLELLLKAPA